MANPEGTSRFPTDADFDSHLSVPVSSQDTTPQAKAAENDRRVTAFEPPIVQSEMKVRPSTRFRRIFDKLEESGILDILELAGDILDILTKLK